jgi:hypothetical protein
MNPVAGSVVTWNDFQRMHKVGIILLSLLPLFLYSKSGSRELRDQGNCVDLFICHNLIRFSDSMALLQHSKSLCAKNRTPNIHTWKHVL